MDISLILATYKRAEILNRTLASFSHLKAERLQWDLWVVDNADDPNTRKLCTSWAQRLPLRYLVETTQGKNNALNRAVPEVPGQLIVFTDDDVIANPDWLVQMWEGAKRWQDHSVFGGRILPDWPEGSKPFDMTNPYLQGAYAIADWDITEGEYQPKLVFGANMAIKRSIFDAGWRYEGNVGPSQNKNYIMGSETEFILRLNNVGYTPVYLPKALVYHQIRPEQMTFKWLKNRSYRAGLGGASQQNTTHNSKMLFGMPRYLIRRLIQIFLKFHYLRIYRSENYIEEGMRFYSILGQLTFIYRNKNIR